MCCACDASLISICMNIYIYLYIYVYTYFVFINHSGGFRLTIGLHRFLGSYRILVFWTINGCRAVLAQDDDGLWERPRQVWFDHFSECPGAETAGYGMTGNHSSHVTWPHRRTPSRWLLPSQFLKNNLLKPGEAGVGPENSYHSPLLVLFSQLLSGESNPLRSHWVSIFGWPVIINHY